MNPPTIPKLRFRAARRRRLWLRPTARVRLTLWYGGTFLLAGTVLIVFCYLFFRRSLNSRDLSSLLSESGVDLLGGRPARLPSGELVTQGELLHRLWSQQRRQATHTALQQSLLALGLMAGLATGFGWIMAGRVLHPLQRITGTARRVADRSLHERIDLQGPRDEFKELADTFDAMLRRLDQAFDSQRRFVANASHELRTPLAINRTLLEVALAHNNAPAELRRVVSTLLATNDRSEQLLDGLLTLARSENQAIKRRPVDLSDIAAHAVEQTAGEAATAGVTVDASPDPAPTTGDPALLERVGLNLVQNAIRHNHRGGWVKITTSSDQPPGSVEMIVANTGPDVPPYDVEELFEPFRRLRDGRADSDHRGIGLGLSIVQSVIRTHGGTVHAISRPGGGLVVTVHLPTTPDADPKPITPTRSKPPPTRLS